MIPVIANPYGYPLNFSENGDHFLFKLFVNESRYISHSVV